MKKVMVRSFFPLVWLLLFSTCSFSQASPVVFCTNCSDKFTQMIDRITNVEKLQEAYKQVSEAMQQTQKQIQMVQTGFDQYQNMLKNTASLPSSILGQLQGQFSQVSQLSKQLKLNRGDASALSQIFNKIYPPKKGLTLPSADGGSAKPWKNPNEVGEEKDAIDQAAMDAQQAAFEVSGQQIEDIEQNADQLDTDVQQLMQTPDGQVKAVMAGNQLLGRLLQESQKLRQLFAVSTQAQAQQAMNERKKVLDQEAWGQATKTDKLNAPTSTTPAAGF
ncbi:hypothetical protein [Fundidesulfovibrio putealis]|uniref:hypothetical protein n=1 Tax=Fundidesulfovibrio putealis TaxID=270496 RepID=UPI000683E206|nr:hypothetical protein [Fundidesulfovibrio putealis]KAF0234913.1 MAG: P-type conjugative transfer protein [Desulfovibrionaceae bacterium]